MAGKLSGWQKLGLIAGVGCLSIVVIVIVGIVAAAMAARSTLAKLGDPNPQRVERRVALPPSGLTAERPATPEPGRTAPLRLTLDLQEGSFTIRPGEPGSDIGVEGEYAPGLYELLENQETDPSTGVRRVTVRFRSKAPAWARFFANMGDDSRRPRLTVTIPRGSPIDLALQVSMGQSQVDLGGLTLGEVSVNASMGEHRIDFAEPVVEGVRQLRVNASMGNVEIEHLGNARADSVQASGSMGNLTANLGGAWPSGTTPDLTFEHSMGELTLRVPASIRLDADVRNSSPGRADSRSQNIEQPDDPNAPTLRLRVTTSMGNSHVVRY